VARFAGSSAHAVEAAALASASTGRCSLACQVRARACCSGHAVHLAGHWGLPRGRGQAAFKLLWSHGPSSVICDSVCVHLDVLWVPKSAGFFSGFDVLWFCCWRLPVGAGGGPQGASDVTITRFVELSNHLFSSTYVGVECEHATHSSFICAFIQLCVELCRGWCPSLCCTTRWLPGRLMSTASAQAYSEL
jgi:hypothetical protein